MAGREWPTPAATLRMLTPHRTHSLPKHAQNTHTPLQNSPYFLANKPHIFGPAQKACFGSRFVICAFTFAVTSALRVVVVGSECDKGRGLVGGRAGE